MRTLKQLERLDIVQILPAHGPCFGDHRTRISETFSHHEERQRAIIGGLGDGPATAYELALALFDESLPALHKEIAAYEVLAHLELMKNTNKVRVRREDGVVRYSV